MQGARKRNNVAVVCTWIGSVAKMERSSTHMKSVKCLRFRGKDREDLKHSAKCLRFKKHSRGMHFKHARVGTYTLIHCNHATE